VGECSHLPLLSCTSIWLPCIIIDIIHENVFTVNIEERETKGGVRSQGARKLNWIHIKRKTPPGETKVYEVESSAAVVN
jgi:hypothetical protein